MSVDDTTDREDSGAHADQSERSRLDAARAALDRVTDPELDRSIVELGYVDDLRVEGEEAAVVFTLPTAWCSPAFAWMMAGDARDALEGLDGVERATVELREHMHETEITTGVNEGRTFEETFPDADGGVEAVRATLDDKARLARQHDAVESLLAASATPEQVVALRRRDVRAPDGEAGRATVSLPGGAVVLSVPAEALVRYLRKAAETGVATEPDDRLFCDPDGEPIPPERFELVHRRTRLAKVNMTGQGTVCDALNRARRGRAED